MRCSGPAGSFRLSFLRPKGVTANPGAYSGWVPGCVVEVDAAQLRILAPSKEKAFEQAARVLRVICQGQGALSIAALLESPPPLSGRDSWTIIVGADIAFSPTALGAHFPEPAIA